MNITITTRTKNKCFLRILFANTYKYLGINIGNKLIITEHTKKLIRIAKAFTVSVESYFSQNKT